MQWTDTVQIFPIKTTKIKTKIWFYHILTTITSLLIRLGKRGLIRRFARILGGLDLLDAGVVNCGCPGNHNTMDMVYRGDVKLVILERRVVDRYAREGVGNRIFLTQTALKK